ncbi:MAG: class I SAM-dependent methyltransferase [Thermoanaerobaculia bacterium]|nr:class I SAM-dependent methyltransferase [Thermoanaerobaculia bacterium]
MTTADAYVAYTHRFFRRWLPVYDLFALPIFWAYRAVTRSVAPRPGLRVLDICTGTGEVALRCARGGADVTGIDLTPEMLDRAHRKLDPLRVELVEMDARNIRFPTAGFDVAVLSLALHDMPRQARLQVLAEALRVARSKVVVLDYELPQGLFGRLLARLIATFETAYFRPFLAAGGVGRVISELGFEAERTTLSPFFAIYVIETAVQPTDQENRP